MGALALLLGQAGAAAASVGPSTTPGTMRPWSVQYMNGPRPVSFDQAVADAKAFNVIAAHATAYRPYVGAMKAANPDLKLFVYMKGVLTTDTNLAEVIYAHDAYGRRIEGVEYPGTWLMNPLAPQTLARQLRRAAMLLGTSGYDGVFLDTIGTAPLSPSYVTSPPVNPATGQLWTATDWLNATATLAGRIGAAIGKPVIGNGLRDGRNYFSPGTRELLQTGMGAAMAEGWLRGAGNPITSYPSELGWKLNVDAVVDAGSGGGSFLAVTKLWTQGTQAQKDAWYRFAVASFLLANDGQAYLTVSYAKGDAAVDYPLNHLDLGAPSGPYAKVDNVYQRSFTLGRVLVNPSSKSTYTLQLGATYHALDGTPVTSVTLAPDTAEILTV